jgi:hypothetical protein
VQPASDLLISALVSGPHDVHPYKKWHGAHWRLLALVELGAPADTRGVEPLLEAELGWIADPERLRKVNTAAGRVRRCALQEGMALRVCAHFEVLDDRADRLAEALLRWQWPDGGWNCDKRPQARRSSFHETWETILGLAAYHQATGETQALDAARRGAELLLDHRLFRAKRTGDVIHPEWLHLHQPAYWHYDVLQGLRAVGAVGGLHDPRAAEALDHVEARRRPDGTWAPSGRVWWRAPGTANSNVEIVDWGRRGQNPVLTRQARQVLAAAGRG